MEYINIISKKEITAVPDWIVYLIGGLAIAAVLSTFLYWAIVKNIDEVITYEIVVGFLACGFFMIGIVICEIFFQSPTGRYKYEATIDKDKITVAQYEEFIEKYNPTIKDGIYYWEE